VLYQMVTLPMTFSDPNQPKQPLFLHAESSFTSLKRLSQSSNFVHTQTVSSISLGMTNHRQIGHGHTTYF